MSSTNIYYVINEIKVRLKTSPLLWCYFGSVFVLCIPYTLAAVFLHWFIPFQNLLSNLLLIVLLFFPINLDVFARERQLNMLDYLAMSPVRFYSIYFSRIIANAVLMVVPIILGFVSILISQVYFIDSSLISLILVYVLIFPLFFFCWYLIAMLILSMIELKYPDSFFRVFLYYLGGFIMIVSLALIYALSGTPVILGVFLGLGLFENLFLSVIAFIIICVVILWFLSLVITRRTNLVVEKILMTGQEHHKDKPHIKLGFYSLHEAIGSKKRSSWKKIGPYFGAVPYLLFFIVSPNRSALTESFSVLFSIHFFFLFLYVLFIVFPRITIEKEFNMEELILSRITIYEYFFRKVFLLLRNIFFPLIVAMITIIVLTGPSILFSNLTSVLLFLVLRAVYFVSVIILLWRLFPVKNLLQSILLSLIGFDILIILTSLIFPPGKILLFFSPIISSLMVLYLIFDPNAAKYTTSITFLNWMTVFLTMAFFLASIILIKAEIRYD